MVNTTYFNGVLKNDFSLRWETRENSNNGFMLGL